LNREAMSQMVLSSERGLLYSQCSIGMNRSISQNFGEILADGFFSTTASEHAKQLNFIFIF